MNRKKNKFKFWEPSILYKTNDYFVINSTYMTIWKNCIGKKYKDKETNLQWNPFFCKTHVIQAGVRYLYETHYDSYYNHILLKLFQ